MPQPTVSDSFEKQTEQGQAPAAVKPVAKPLPRPVAPAGLDWLEQGMGSRRFGDDAAKKAKEIEEEKKRQEQLVQLDALDKRRSKQMYEEIQQAIRLIRKQKASQPTQNITGATGYDPQQHENPETFWQKVKKKQAEAKKNLPWSSKQGMGTGEITRGVSG